MKTYAVTLSKHEDILVNSEAQKQGYSEVESFLKEIFLTFITKTDLENCLKEILSNYNKFPSKVAFNLRNLVGCEYQIDDYTLMDLEDIFIRSTFETVVIKQKSAHSINNIILTTFVKR